MTPEEWALLPHLGHRVARARGDLGMTQSTAARSAGMPVAALGRIERGEQPASVLRLAAPAGVLRVPLVALLRGLPGDPGRL